LFVNFIVGETFPIEGGSNEIVSPCGGLEKCEHFMDGLAQGEKIDIVLEEAHIDYISLLTNNLWLVWPCDLADKFTRSKRQKTPLRNEELGS
jgi:hypothetical protein